jgi:hypothetical protein
MKTRGHQAAEIADLRLCFWGFCTDSAKTVVDTTATQSEQPLAMLQIVPWGWQSSSGQHGSPLAPWPIDAPSCECGPANAA